MVDPSASQKKSEVLLYKVLRREVCQTVQQLLLRRNLLCKRLGVANPSYPDFNASKNWWSVLIRHHDLIIRKPERLGSVRVRMMLSEVVSKYYTDHATLVDTLDLSDKLQYIWNCNENGKSFEHDPVGMFQRHRKRRMPRMLVV